MQNLQKHREFVVRQNVNLLRFNSENSKMKRQMQSYTKLLLIPLALPMLCIENFTWNLYLYQAYNNNKHDPQLAIEKTLHAGRPVRNVRIFHWNCVLWWKFKTKKSAEPTKKFTLRQAQFKYDFSFLFSVLCFAKTQQRKTDLPTTLLNESCQIKQHKYMLWSFLPIKINLNMHSHKQIDEIMPSHWKKNTSSNLPLHRN